MKKMNENAMAQISGGNDFCGTPAYYEAFFDAFAACLAGGAGSDGCWLAGQLWEACKPKLH